MPQKVIPLQVEKKNASMDSINSGTPNSFAGTPNSFNMASILMRAMKKSKLRPRKESPQASIDKLHTSQFVKPPRYLCCRSLVFCVVSLVMILIALIIAVSGVWATMFGLTVSKFTDTLRENAVLSITSYLDGFVVQPKLIADTSVAPMKANLIDRKNHDVVKAQLGEVFYSSVSQIKGPPLYVGFYEKTKGFMAWHGTLDSSYLSPLRFLSAWENVTAPGMKVYVKSQNTVEAPLPTSPTYGASSLTVAYLLNFYLTSFQETSSWAKSYLYTECDNALAARKDCPVILMYGHLVRNSTTKILDYMGFVAFESASLSTALQSLASVTDGHVTYIFESSTKSMIATSTGNVKFYDSSATTRTIYKADEYPDHERIKKSAELVVSKYGADSYTGLSSRQSFSYKTDSNTIFVDCIRYTDEYYLDWVIVSTTTLNDLVKTEIIIGSITGAFSLAACILGLLIGITLSIMIALPMFKLLRKMRHVQDMSLEKIKFSTGFFKYSIFSELARMQWSFRALSIHLKELKAFIPSYAIGDGLDKNEEEEIGDIVSQIDSTGTCTTGGSNSIISVSSRFDLGLSGKDVTILNVLISEKRDLKPESFNDNEAPAPLRGAFTDFLQSVENAVKLSGGEILHFSKKHIQVVWNATRKNQNHSTNGLTSAIRIIQRASGLDLRCVLTTGTCLCGLIGTRERKKFTVSGRAVEVGENLFSIFDKYPEAKIIADESTMSKNGQSFVYRQLTEFNYKGKDRTISEVFDAKNCCDDEWLYELKNQANNDRFLSWNRAYNHLRNSDFDFALEDFKAYTEENPDDKIVLPILHAAMDHVVPCLQYSKGNWNIARDAENESDEN